LLFAP